MTNLVSISDHERFECQVIPELERKGAQLEDGYVRTANALVEALCKAPLTSREARIVRAIERATFGWDRSAARLSQSVLAKMTGLTPKRCSEAVNSLLAKKVLRRDGGAQSPLGINTRVGEWDFSAQKARVSPKRQPSPNWGQIPQDGDEKRPQDGDTNTDSKDKTHNPRNLPAQQDPKPTPKPQPKKPPEPEEIPDWLPPAAWQDFLDHRKDLKAPMSALARKKAINMLDQLRREGSQPAEVLEQSIINGWKGVFAVKGQRNNGKQAPPNPQAEMDDCAGKVYIPGPPPDADTWRGRQ